MILIMLLYCMCNLPTLVAPLGSTTMSPQSKKGQKMVEGQCKCESTTHLQTSHNECPYNKTAVQCQLGSYVLFPSDCVTIQILIPCH